MIFTLNSSEHSNNVKLRLIYYSLLNLYCFLHEKGFSSAIALSDLACIA